MGVDRVGMHGGSQPTQTGRRRTSFYRAVALDFDGTIASGGRPPADQVVEALAEARSAGVALILVTGRILGELTEVWPQSIDCVDCIIAENGAVLQTRTWRRLLAAPIDARLDAALSSADVPFRRGEVLLAGAAADEAAILAQVRALQLGCQTVANRGELMVVPAGMTKASGLYHALGELGLSFHNAVAVGDAENDLALLEMSELGIAVGDAVETLKAAADIVLAEPDGEGVAGFLRGDVLAGRRVVHTQRWQLHLGVTDDGGDASLPASQLNVLVTGSAGAGKSYLAGLLAEQLVQRDYSVLVIDPEGDHVGLSHLSGGLVVGGGPELPEPDEVLRLLHHRYASVIVDLSPLARDATGEYQRRLLTRVEAHRRATGLPHWVFLDEADRTVGRVTASLPGFEPAQKGYCFITWRPRDLAAEAVASLDAVVAMTSDDPEESVIDLAAAVGGIARAELARQLAAGPDRAVLVRRGALQPAQVFTVAERVTPHLRHTHKYAWHPLDRERCFYFRRNPTELVGARAGNLAELEDRIGLCERAVLRHHCPHHDFSRWVADVFHDDVLAEELAAVEASVGRTSPAAVVEHARLGLVRALQVRLTE